MWKWGEIQSNLLEHDLLPVFSGFPVAAFVSEYLYRDAVTHNAQEEVCWPLWEHNADSKIY